MHRAAPGVTTPFVSAIVRLDDGTSVKSNLTGVEPSPDNVRCAMRVQMATHQVGGTADTAVIAFSFEPVDEESG